MQGEAVPDPMFGNGIDTLARWCKIFQDDDESDSAFKERVKKYFPCGTIAKSFFNDIIKLASTSKKQGFSMNETDIAWPEDKDRLKKVKYELHNGTVTDKYLFQRYPEIIKKSESVHNEHYSVWFRSEFLSDFIKRYGRLKLDRDLDKGEVLAFDVESAFEVASFRGTKSIVIQRYDGRLGSDLSTMGYIFIALGGVSLVEALVVLVDIVFFKIRRRNSVVS